MKIASRALQLLFDRLPIKLAVFLANAVYRDGRRFTLDSDGDWLRIENSSIIASPVAYRQRLISIREQTQEYFLPFYRPQPTDLVVDVGAGIGEETVSLADRVERILAIEAHPATFRCLQKTIQLSRLTNVEAIHCAVSDRTGTLKISDETDHVANAVSEDGQIEVTALTLQEICDARGIRKINFLKSNIEGAERMLLAGVSNLEICNVAIACHDFVADQTGNEFFRTREFVESWLEAHGYEVWSQNSAKPWISDTVYGHLRALPHNQQISARDGL